MKPWISYLRKSFNPLLPHQQINRTLNCHRTALKTAERSCRILCDIIAPNAGDKLYEALTMEKNVQATNDLGTRATAYKSAPSKNLKTQLLSLYALNCMNEKLKKIHKPFEELSDRQKWCANMAVGRVFPCSVILIMLITLSFLIRLQTTIFRKGNSPKTWGAYHDPRYLEEYTTKANFKKVQYSAFQLATWRTNFRLLVLAKIKRSQTPTIRYYNCVSTFHPIINLLHDIELNPGPNQGASARQANRTRNNNITVAHLNVRSSVLENKFDILTISESWLDNSATNLELEYTRVWFASCR